MNAIRIEKIIETDGELHLSSLPCRKGDKVEAIVLFSGQATSQEREEAVNRYLARARASAFCSVGPYPTRDELHERS